MEAEDAVLRQRTEPGEQLAEGLPGVLDHRLVVEDEGVDAAEVADPRAVVALPEREPVCERHAVPRLERACHTGRRSPDEHGRHRSGEDLQPEGEEQAEPRVLPDRRTGFGEGLVEHRPRVGCGTHGGRPLPAVGQCGRCVPAAVETVEQVLVVEGEREALPVLGIALGPLDAVVGPAVAQPEGAERAGQCRGAAPVHPDHEHPRLGVGAGHRRVTGAGDGRSGRRRPPAATARGRS